MEIGVYVPNVHHGMGLEAFLGRPFPPGLAVNPETFITMARLAEEVGLDSLWFGDHVIFPARTKSPHPNSGQMHGAEIRNTEPIFDPMALLAWLGAQTNRVKLGISVLVIPYRNPVITAKYLATVDKLTGGRLILGAGVGMLEEEFDALAAPFKDRGTVTDEYIAVMRALWTEDEPTFEGKHYQIQPGMKFLPKPANGTIPIWIGGNTKFAIRRSARIGDGWLAPYGKHEEIAESWDQIRQLAADYGRDPSKITLAVQTRYFVNEEPYPTAPPGVGSPGKIADDIIRFAEMGVEHLELAPPPGPTTEAVAQQIEFFAEKVRPLLPKNIQTAVKS